MAARANGATRASRAGGGRRRGPPDIAAAVPFLILATLSTQVTASLPQPFRYRLTTRFTYALVPHQRVLLAEVKGESDRFLVVDSTQAVCHRIESGGLVPEWHLTFDPPGSIFPIAAPTREVDDATGDGRPDILLVTGDPEAGYSLACYDPWGTASWQAKHGRTSEPLYRVGPFIRDCEPWRADDTGHLGVYAFGDADEDGHREVYASSFVTVRGCEPRRLLAISGPSGKVLWQFPVGPQINSVSFLMRPDSGKTHIILSSYAPNNGFTDGPCPDSESCVISLSPAGEVDWCTKLGGRFSRSWVAIGDLDRDGQDDIVVGMQLGPDDRRTLPALLRLDPTSGAIVERHAFASGVRELHTADLDGDARLEIVILGQDQGVYCMSSAFRPSWAESTLAGREIAGIHDLDSDGKKEILVVSPPSIKILDAHGRLVASEPIDPDLDARLAVFNGRPVIVVRGGALARLVTLDPPVISPITAGIAAGLIVLAAILAGVLALMRRAGTQEFARHVARERLLDAVRAFRHGPGGSSLDKIDNIRFTLMNWETHLRHIDKNNDAFTLTARQFAASILPELRELAAAAQAADVPREHWIHLVACADGATRELRHLAQPGATAGADGPDPALRDLDKIMADLDAIRHHLDRFYRAPLLTTMALALEARSHCLDGARVQVISGDAVGQQTQAVVSAVALQKVMENLLDNALSAMAHSDWREIRIHVTCDGSYYQVDVEDTGCGIPRERWESIFHGGDSTRSEDGGFGLRWSRQELARHGASIFVHDSKPGRGTTFRIRLRAPDPE